MKIVKKLFKNLTTSFVLTAVPIVTLPTTLIAISNTEQVEALELKDIFDFAKSKGIKERCDIQEYEDLLKYDKKTPNKNKSVSKICEQYKTMRVLECVNVLEKTKDEQSKKCVAIFLDRIVHGLEKINYKNGIDAIKTFVNEEKSNSDLYKLGSNYVSGFIVQEMLYNSASWNMCWTIEQNYNDATATLHEFLSSASVNIEAEKIKDILNKNVKNFILSLFEGSMEEPVGLLEQTIFDIRSHVIDVYVEGIAGKTPILPKNVNLPYIKNQISGIEERCEINLNDDSNNSFWANLRHPNAIFFEVKKLNEFFEQVNRDERNLEILKKYIEAHNLAKQKAEHETLFLGRIKNLLDKAFKALTEMYTSLELSININKDNKYNERLTFNLARLRNVFATNDHNSNKDLENMDVLNSFDYENFYKTLGQYEVKKGLQSSNDLAEELKMYSPNVKLNESVNTLISFLVSINVSNDFDLTKKIFDFQSSIFLPLKDNYFYFSNFFKNRLITQSPEPKDL